MSRACNDLQRPAKRARADEREDRGFFHRIRGILRLRSKADGAGGQRTHGRV